MSANLTSLHVCGIRKTVSLLYECSTQGENNSLGTRSTLQPSLDQVFPVTILRLSRSADAVKDKLVKDKLILHKFAESKSVMGEAMEVAAAAQLLPDEDLEFETSKGVKPINTFDGMKLKQGLIKGIYTFGFEKPSAIQQRAILPIVSGPHHCGKLKSNVDEC